MILHVIQLLTGCIMVGVVLCSRRCKINPDNVATPIAASLGDLTTLSLLSGVGCVLYKEIGKFTSLREVSVTVVKCRLVIVLRKGKYTSLGLQWLLSDVDWLLYEEISKCSSLKEVTVIVVKYRLVIFSSRLGAFFQPKSTDIRGISNEYLQHIFLWKNKKNNMWIPTLELWVG